MGPNQRLPLIIQDNRIDGPRGEANASEPMTSATEEVPRTVQTLQRQIDVSAIPGTSSRPIEVSLQMAYDTKDTCGICLRYISRNTTSLIESWIQCNLCK